MSTLSLPSNPIQARGRGPVALRWMLGMVLALFSLGLYAQPAPVAGKVMFVNGSATRQAAQDAPQPIARDAEVHQGDLLTTSADSHLYVRMADGALLVLRPGATLSIDQWQYNSDRPELSQIKYTLKQGVSRYVSGKGSQAAKNGFRFNTPMAAIGVRGTDFTVLTRAELTQVAVRSGAVVVSAFDASCVREALGPCEGMSAAELVATPSASFLQLRAGEQRPQLIRPNGTLGPDQTAPALGNEPTASNSKTSTTEGAGAIDITLTDVARNEKLAASLVNAAKEPLATWGRWGQLSAADAAAYMRQLLKDRQLVAISADYALALNPRLPMQLPESGVGKFRLNEHDGIYRQNSAAAPQPTHAIGGSLQIDFDRRKYQTELQLDLNGQALAFQSNGIVDSGNLLQSTVLNPAASLKGVVGGPDAGQAAYLYRSKLPSGAEISGITAWGR